MSIGVGTEAVCKQRENDMGNASKRMVIGSMGVAALVSVLSVLDMVMGIPFSKQIAMDVMFLIAALIVLYLGYDAFQDIS